jgi:hypothetical protein
LDVKRNRKERNIREEITLVGLMLLKMKVCTTCMFRTCY